MGVFVDGPGFGWETTRLTDRADWGQKWDRRTTPTDIYMRNAMKGLGYACGTPVGISRVCCILSSGKDLKQDDFDDQVKRSFAECLCCCGIPLFVRDLREYRHRSRVDIADPTSTLSSSEDIIMEFIQPMAMVDEQNPRPPARKAFEASGILPTQHVVPPTTALKLEDSSMDK